MLFVASVGVREGVLMFQATGRPVNKKGRRSRANRAKCQYETHLSTHSSLQFLFLQQVASNCRTRTAEINLPRNVLRFRFEDPEISF